MLPEHHVESLEPYRIPRAQLLMTGEPSLVAGAAALLESALRYNGDELPRLYLTGAFFMALAYCGSNLVDVAQLFRVCPPWRTAANHVLYVWPWEWLNV